MTWTVWWGSADAGPYRRRFNDQDEAERFALSKVEVGATWVQIIPNEYSGRWSNG